MDFEHFAENQAIITNSNFIRHPTFQVQGGLGENRGDDVQGGNWRQIGRRQLVDITPGDETAIITGHRLAARDDIDRKDATLLNIGISLPAVMER